MHLTILRFAAAMLVCLAALPSRALADNDSSGASRLIRSPWIDEKFGDLALTAGPATSGGFGAALKGDGRYSWLSDTSNGEGCHAPLSPFLGYATDDSLNTQSGSADQISIDLKIGMDAGLFCGKWNFIPPEQISEECKTNPQAGCPLAGHPELVADFGGFGDIRYRYGTFPVKTKQEHVNQLLGGAGIYAVWPIIGHDSDWFGINIWPRATVTYYTVISNDSSAPPIALPDGIKADFIQAELKSSVNLGPKGLWGAKSYPFRLTITYDGSQPTTGTDKAWEDHWNIQLSSGILGTAFRPAVTYQSGRNGGLKYDEQVLIGLVADIL